MVVVSRAQVWPCSVCTASLRHPCKSPKLRNDIGGDAVYNVVVWRNSPSAGQGWGVLTHSSPSGQTKNALTDMVRA